MRRLCFFVAKMTSQQTIFRSLLLEHVICPREFNSVGKDSA